MTTQVHPPIRYLPEVKSGSDCDDYWPYNNMKEIMNALDDTLKEGRSSTNTKPSQYEPWQCNLWYPTSPSVQKSHEKDKFAEPVMSPVSSNTSTCSWFPKEDQLLESVLSPESSTTSTCLFDFELEDICGFLMEFATDQHGSRFLQQKIIEADEFTKQTAFKELRPHIKLLTSHIFGNYVIQKFLEFGTTDQRRVIMNSYRGKWSRISMDLYGCRVVQKAVEVLPASYQLVIVRELIGKMMECVMHQNGNHVIQRCVMSVPHNLLAVILETFVGEMYSLSIHPYGCRVMQRILEHCSRDQMEIVLIEILHFTESLVLNQYGNYVIQHVLEHGREKDKSKIVSALAGKICSLSQHKFASNVVEKCLTYGTPSDRTKIIKEIILEKSALLTMTTNQYGNYVIQKAIDMAELQQKHKLVTLIYPQIPVLRKYLYARHTISKINALMSKVPFSQW